MIVFRSLLFWLLLTSGAALVWPVESFGFDPFPLSRNALWTLIVVTMFALGTLVRDEELQPLRQNPWWVALGLAAQVLAMPAAAWCVVKCVPMPSEMAAGVLLVGCVPGAMASNVLTNAAGGSVAYSVSLTTVATLLSPLSVPLVLSFVTDLDSDKTLIDPAQQSIRLFCFVVLPTIAGYGVSRVSQRVKVWSNHFSPTIASIALLWIIASVVAGQRDRLMEVGAVIVLVLLVVNLLGYAAGFSIATVAKLPIGFRRALTLEVGMQNAGLGTVLAVELYGEQTMAAIPTAAYTFGCMLTGTLLAMGWRRLGRDLSPEVAEESGQT